MRASIPVRHILRNAVAVRTSVAHARSNSGGGGSTLMAIVRGSGAVSAAVDIYGAHDNSANIQTAVLLGQLTPSGTDVGADGIAIDASWPFIFADLTAITGNYVDVTEAT